MIRQCRYCLMRDGLRSLPNFGSAIPAVFVFKPCADQTCASPRASNPATPAPARRRHLQRAEAWCGACVIAATRGDLTPAQL